MPLCLAEIPWFRPTLRSVCWKELGWTQKDLGERLHVSDRAVSKWERAAGFPDVSLLEPLADALGLSVLELLNGERMRQEEIPPLETERATRGAVQQLGERLRRGMVRYRAAVCILAVLLLLAVGSCLWRAYGDWPVMHYEEREVSIGEAVKAAPFVVITGEEFRLAREITEDPAIRAAAEQAGSEWQEISEDLIAPYRDLLRMEGEPAACSEALLTQYSLCLDYSAGMRRCIMEIAWDGTVRKIAVVYAGDGRVGTKEPVVISENNEHFRIGKAENRDLYRA